MICSQNLRDNHKGVGEHTVRDHHPISTQSPENFRSSQEHEKVPQNKNRRFLRARVDSVQLTLAIASTHVIARINAKRTSQFGLKSMKRKISKITPKITEKEKTQN
jgi:ribosomal protein S30